MADDPVTGESERLILGLSAAEIANRFREESGRAVREHHAAGHPVYGTDAHGTLVALLPDGRVVPIAAVHPATATPSDTRAS